MWISSEKLEGDYLILEPLRIEHVAQLEEAVQDGECWKLWFANVPRPEEMSNYVEYAIEASSKVQFAK